MIWRFLECCVRCGIKYNKLCKLIATNVLQLEDAADTQLIQRLLMDSSNSNSPFRVTVQRIRVAVAAALRRCIMNVPSAIPVVLTLFAVSCGAS